MPCWGVTTQSDAPEQRRDAPSRSQLSGSCHVSPLDALEQALALLKSEGGPQITVCCPFSARRDCPVPGVEMLPQCTQIWPFVYPAVCYKYPFPTPERGSGTRGFCVIGFGSSSRARSLLYSHSHTCLSTPLCSRRYLLPSGRCGGGAGGVRLSRLPPPDAADP